MMSAKDENFLFNEMLVLYHYVLQIRRLKKNDLSTEKESMLKPFSFSLWDTLLQSTTY